MHAPQRRHWALLTLAVASVSFSAILVRLAHEAPPLVISFYRLLFATLMLAPFALGPARKELGTLTRRDHVWFAGIGLLLAAHFATWVTSLSYTSVASSAVIVATESLWVPLGAAYLLRERVGPRVWVGVAVAFAGSLLLVGGDLGETRFGGQALVGDFLALAGALAASLYFLAGRTVRQRVSLLTYATIVYAWSTLFLLAMVLARGDPLYPYSRYTFLILFLFAFFPMILGHTIINYLLRWVPPHYVSTSILAEPVVSALLAVLLLQESMRPLVAVGGLVILAGILVATVRPGPATRATPQVPETQP